MNLGNYIHNLLLENETVIIPGLGAFITTYKPAEISGDEIKPPSKEISFIRQIKINDGLLVSAVARKGKISQTNALKRIEKERENILYQLDKGEKVILENIGNLFYNEKNEVQFTPFQDENLLLDSFGLETISFEDKIEKTVETESADALIEAVEPVTADAEIISEAEIADKTETGITDQSTLEDSNHEVEAEIYPVSEQGSEKIKLPEFKPAPVNEKQVESKKTSWMWYLLILIPIVVAGYFLFRNNFVPNKVKNIQEQTTNNEQEGIQIQTIPPTDSIKNDSVSKTEVDTVKKVEPEIGSSDGNSKYYLVGGGFKNEENVEKYILLLKEKGIEGIRLGKRGSMYLVGIASFDSEAEAYKSLNEHFKANPEWSLWVYKK